MPQLQNFHERETCTVLDYLIFAKIYWRSEFTHQIFWYIRQQRIHWVLCGSLWIQNSKVLQIKFLMCGRCYKWLLSARAFIQPVISHCRYILISCHSLYDKLYTPRYICLMLVFAWVFSFSMMIPPLVEVWGRLGLDPPTFSCTILKKNGKSPKKMLFVLGFILPCVVIILSYTCIYWKVRQSQRNLQAHK